MKKILRSINVLALLLFLVLNFSCKTGPTKPVESPTRGSIKIAVDESYQLLFDTEIFTFQAQYKDAHIAVSYRPEIDAIADLMNDSVRLAVINRDLTKQEKDKLLQLQVIVRSTKIAYDALAFIVNKENPDSQLLLAQLKDIFTGKAGKWQDINKKSTLQDINVVFDNPKSGNVRFVMEKFGITGKLPSNCFAVNNNQEVLSYVENNRNGLGIIGVNWISDPDDSITKGFMKKIKVLSVGDATNTDGSGLYYKPYQAYLAQGVYPFTREAYMVSRESFSGLGTGFASFVAGETGQRIVLKSGLVPATMPVRLVEIKN